MWSKEENLCMVKLHKLGYTVKEMQEVFPSRSKGSIRGRLERLGLIPNAKVGVPDLDAFRRLVELRKA